MDLKKADLFKKFKVLQSKLKGRMLLCVLLGVGLLFLLLPSGEAQELSLSETPELPSFSLEEAEKQLEAALERIDGAGRVDVLLTLHAGVEAQLAEDTDADSNETVIISGGSGKQKAIIRRYVYPEYQGALVVAQGGGAAATRLRLTEAVAALTGLSKDRITVLKMQEGRS